MARDTQIRNAHRSLVVDKAAVKRVIQILDTDFWYTPADLPHLTPAARRRAKAPRSGPALPEGELSLVFMNDKSLAQLHAEFLDDPTTTDVITFEGDPAMLSAGEVCVSADTAAAFAKAHRRNFAEELTLYVVHGWLHLAGYDDLMPVKKRRMRAAEKRAMQLITAAGAVPGFKLKA